MGCTSSSAAKVVEQVHVPAPALRFEIRPVSDHEQKEISVTDYSVEPVAHKVAMPSVQQRPACSEGLHLDMKEIPEVILEDSDTVQIEEDHESEPHPQSSRFALQRTPCWAPVCCLPHWMRPSLSPLVEKHSAGFGFWAMPESQNAAKLSQLASSMQIYEWVRPSYVANPPFSMVKAPADQVAHAMYEATKVPGVFERVPEELRGVFWMKGNGVGEELCVLHYMEFDEQNGTMLAPLAPFSWAWAGGVPKDAPFDGAMYSPETIESSAVTLVQRAAVGNVVGAPISYLFQWRSDGLNHADLYAGFVDMRVNMLNGWGYLRYSVGWMAGALGSACCVGTQTFTLEARESNSWKRGIWFGGCGCDCIEFGSYDLRRILDADGNPVEGNWDEFLEYMGDVPLLTWSGQAASAANIQQ